MLMDGDAGADSDLRREARGIQLSSAIVRLAHPARHRWLKPRRRVIAVRDVGSGSSVLLGEYATSVYEGLTTGDT